jgi:hypothetical protein
VKALVTGGIPSFRDYVANFQSSEIDQDNMVWQLQRHGKCLVFYGDETWLKLFPTAFTRFEGTTSFFVADTVEVDRNVTRNLPRELERYKAAKPRSPSTGDSSRTSPPESSSHRTCDPDSDWDVMFLHYLGLDHIGHLQGPRSPLMYPKQVEMNAIFENLYKTIGEDTLLIMSGDHGMNEEGAHGGPSDGETSPALVLASPAFNAKSLSSSNLPSESTSNTNQGIPIPTRIDQIDLVPTLSTLIGIPTPLNSVGKLIPNVLEDLYRNERSDMLRAYQLNALHIHRLLKTSTAICKDGNVAKYHQEGPCLGVSEDARKAEAQLSSARDFHEAFASSEEAERATIANDFEAAVHGYQDFLKTSSSLFTHALSEYDDYLLVSAIFGFAVSALFALVTWKSTLISHPPWALVGIVAVSHFLIDSFVLISMSSSLASTMVRILTSALFGYCIAHIIIVARNSIKSNFNESESIVSTLISKATSFAQSIIATEFGLVGAVLLVGLALRPLVYSSSSFIEEEHLTFFYMSCTAMLALMHAVIAGALDVVSCSFTLGVVLLAMRTCRLWNQSGFQGIGKPDVVQMLISNPGLKNMLLFITFASFASYVVYQMLIFIGKTKSSPSSYQISLNRLPVNLHRLLLRVWLGSWCCSIFFAFVFQCTGTHGWAGIAHYCNLVCIIVAASWMFLWKSPDSSIGLIDGLLMVKWTILAISLLICRHNNVPLIGLWILQSHGMIKLAQGFCVSSGPHQWKDRVKDWFYAGSSSNGRHGAIRPPIWVWSLICYNLGQYAYFSQGNSNSLASIDIAGAYAGLSGYQDGLVGLFVTLLLYAGPLTFQLTLLIILVHQDHDAHGSNGTIAGGSSLSASGSVPSQSGEHSLHVALLDVLRIRLVGRSWVLAIYSIFITAHRGHLFIWTVFAPKLLYEIFHSVAFGLQIAGLLAFCTAQLKRKKEDALPMRGY